MRPRKRFEGGSIVRVQDQPAYLVGIRINERMIHDLSERQLGQDQLRGDCARARSALRALQADRPTFSSLALANTVADPRTGIVRH